MVSASSADAPGTRRITVPNLVYFHYTLKSANVRAEVDEIVDKIKYVYNIPLNEKFILLKLCTASTYAFHGP